MPTSDLVSGLVLHIEKAKKELFDASREAGEASPLAKEIPAIQELDELVAQLNKLQNKIARLPL